MAKEGEIDTTRVLGIPTPILEWAGKLGSLGEAIRKAGGVFVWHSQDLSYFREGCQMCPEGCGHDSRPFEEHPDEIYCKLEKVPVGETEIMVYNDRGLIIPAVGIVGVLCGAKQPKRDWMK